MSRNWQNPQAVDDLPLFGGAPVPSPQYVSDAAAKARDKAIASLRRGSGEHFIQAAGDFVVAHLRTFGPKTGEQLTDACKAAGIRPENDKAFGAVYQTLSRRGLIRREGWAPRRKGNLTGGATLWAVVASRG